MEAKGLGFLQEVSDSYKRIVSVAKGEYELIRAEGSVEEVREEIWQHVKPLFPSPGTG
jgi:thymidylate kinase